MELLPEMDKLNLFDEEEKEYMKENKICFNNHYYGILMNDFKSKSYFTDNYDILA